MPGNLILPLSQTYTWNGAIDYDLLKIQRQPGDNSNHSLTINGNASGRIGKLEIDHYGDGDAIRVGPNTSTGVCHIGWEDGGYVWIYTRPGGSAIHQDGCQLAGGSNKGFKNLVFGTESPNGSSNPCLIQGFSGGNPLSSGFDFCVWVPEAEGTGAVVGWGAGAEVNGASNYITNCYQANTKTGENIHGNGNISGSLSDLPNSHPVIAYCIANKRVPWLDAGQQLSGGLTMSGATKRNVTNRRTAGIAPAGATRRNVNSFKLGSMALAGAVTNAKFKSANPDGTLTPAGLLKRAPASVKGGTLATTGLIVRAPAAIRGGSLGLAGAITNLQVSGGNLVVSGVLQPTGLLANTPKVVRLGTLGLSGEAVHALLTAEGVVVFTSWLDLFNEETVQVPSTLEVTAFGVTATTAQAQGLDLCYAAQTGAAYLPTTSFVKGKVRFNVEARSGEWPSAQPFFELLGTQSPFRLAFSEAGDGRIDAQIGRMAFANIVTVEDILGGVATLDDEVLVEYEIQRSVSAAQSYEVRVNEVVVATDTPSAASTIDAITAIRAGFSDASNDDGTDLGVTIRLWDMVVATGDIALPNQPPDAESPPPPSIDVFRDSRSRIAVGSLMIRP